MGKLIDSMLISLDESNAGRRSESRLPDRSCGLPEKDK